MTETTQDNGKRKVICISAGGSLVGGSPELEQGDKIQVVLLTRESAADWYTLDIKYKRIRLKTSGSGTLKEVGNKIAWKRASQEILTLDSGGELNIEVRTPAHPESLDAKKKCKVPMQVNKTVLRVAGRYYFTAGVMVAYTDLASRQYTLTGANGEVRIVRDDSGGAEMVANIVAYPFGVDDRTPYWPAVGGLLGTAVRAPGKIWYGGLELTWPVGFGISGGGVLVGVPALNGGLKEGQTTSQPEIATRDDIELSWYAGINLNAQLFEWVFGRMFGESKSTD